METMNDLDGEMLSVPTEHIQLDFASEDQTVFSSLLRHNVEQLRLSPSQNFSFTYNILGGPSANTKNTLPPEEECAYGTKGNDEMDMLENLLEQSLLFPSELPAAKFNFSGRGGFQEAGSFLLPAEQYEKVIQSDEQIFMLGRKTQSQVDMNRGNDEYISSSCACERRNGTPQCENSRSCLHGTNIEQLLTRSGGEDEAVASNTEVLGEQNINATRFTNCLGTTQLPKRHGGFKPIETKNVSGALTKNNAHREDNEMPPEENPTPFIDFGMTVMENVESPSEEEKRDGNGTRSFKEEQVVTRKHTGSYNFGSLPAELMPHVLAPGQSLNPNYAGSKNHSRHPTAQSALGDSNTRNSETLRQQACSTDRSYIPLSPATKRIIDAQQQNNLPILRNFVYSESSWQMQESPQSKKYTDPLKSVLDGNSEGDCGINSDVKTPRFGLDPRAVRARSGLGNIGLDYVKAASAQTGTVMSSAPPGAVVNVVSGEKRSQKRKRTRVEDLDPTQVHVCSFEDCRKKFAKKYNLKIHERRHRGDLPFICPLCQKKFMWQSSYTRHLRVHESRRDGSGKKLRRRKTQNKNSNYRIERVSDSVSTLTMNGIDLTVDYQSSESVVLAVSLCTMNSIPYDIVLEPIRDGNENRSSEGQEYSMGFSELDMIDQFLVTDEPPNHLLASMVAATGE